MVRSLPFFKKKKNHTIEWHGRISNAGIKFVFDVFSYGSGYVLVISNERTNPMLPHAALD
jgi:hypothetical protein